MGLKNNKVSISQAVVPIRALFTHLRLFFLVILCIALIAASKTDVEPIKKARAYVMDIAVPLLSALSHPVTTYHQIHESVSHAFNVYEENARLRQDNARLKRMQAVAIELQAENTRMRKLLKIAPEPWVSYITARVVGNASGPYIRSAMINAGARDGVHEGQVVRNNIGLIGRVTEVGNHSARILLITDLNSRIPVMTTESRERAVMVGMNGPYTVLNHLPIDTNISVGEKIMTSGDGEHFPLGIEIGVVTSVSRDKVLVKPFVDWTRLEYITVVDVKPQEEEGAAE